MTCAWSILATTTAYQALLANCCFALSAHPQLWTTGVILQLASTKLALGGCAVAIWSTVTPRVFCSFTIARERTSAAMANLSMLTRSLASSLSTQQLLMSASTVCRPSLALPANTTLWRRLCLLMARSSMPPVFLPPAAVPSRPMRCHPTSRWCQRFPKRSRKNRSYAYCASTLTPLVPTSSPPRCYHLERLQIGLFIRLIEHETNFLHTSVEKRLHLVTTLLRVTDDGHRIHHCIRHQLGRLVTLARLVGLTHTISLRTKTNAMKVLMVKHPHAANVKGNMGPFAVARCGNIVRDVGRD